MKKLFILLLIAVSPVYAVCSIDSNESLCSLPEFRQQVRPIYNNPLENTNINAPAMKLQPLERKDPINEMRGPNNDLNYNSGCQFGVCLQPPERSNMEK